MLIHINAFVMNVELSRYSKTIPPTPISVAFYTLHFSENYDKVRNYTTYKMFVKDSTFKNHAQIF